MDIRLSRVYEPAHAADGYRVLADRLWPRGVAKDDLPIDEWCKAVTPSNELRKWFHSHPEEFAEFERRYRAELRQPEAATELKRLREVASSANVTLLTAARDPERSHLRVLAKALAPTRKAN